MTVRPTIYLTNVASVAAVDRGDAPEDVAVSVGPGRRHTIQRHSRGHEVGSGGVWVLMPSSSALSQARKASALEGPHAAFPPYAARIAKLWDRQRADMAPGRLMSGAPASADAANAFAWDGDWWVIRGDVQDGDTLTCSCSRERAKLGHCHRVIAADYLHDAGWRVILDGVELRFR